MEVDVAQGQLQLGLTLFAVHGGNGVGEQGDGLVGLAEMIGHDVGLDECELGQVVGADVTIGLVDAFRQALVCLCIAAVLGFQLLVVGLDGAGNGLPVKGVALAFVDDVVVAFLGDVVLLVVQADACQIVDLCVLVVGLAVDALALGQGDVVVFLLKGKPNEKLGKLQVVGFLLGLFQQGDAQVVGDAVVDVIEQHGLQAVADVVVL